MGDVIIPTHGSKCGWKPSMYAVSGSPRARSRGCVAFPKPASSVISRPSDRGDRAIETHRATAAAPYPPPPPGDDRSRVSEQPPATIADAAARMEALTRIARKPTQVRQFLPALGMQPRQGGMLPAQADVEAQETCKQTVWSRGEPKPSAFLKKFCNINGIW